MLNKNTCHICGESMPLMSGTLSRSKTQMVPKKGLKSFKKDYIKFKTLRKGVLIFILGPHSHI